jgi:hypothetical protein
MLDKDFISRDLALELREISFEEECMAFYNVDLEIIPLINKPYLTSSVDGAPTFSQVFRWFRDNHGLDSEIYMNHEFGQKIYTYLVLKLDGSVVTWLSKGNPEKFRSYEEAQVGCIKETIQIIKGENENPPFRIS